MTEAKYDFLSLNPIGILFGKPVVKNIGYDVIYEHKNSGFPFELRQYGERYAVEIRYTGSDDSAFIDLARYLGLLSVPQNVEQEPLPFQAPVMFLNRNKGTSALVEEDGDGWKKLRLMLPPKYNSLDKIPTPTNPRIQVRRLDPCVGAAYKYSGNYSVKRSSDRAVNLAEELQAEGIEVPTQYAVENYQFWAYNPPYTPSFFRRNEIWLELEPEQVAPLVSRFYNLRQSDNVGPAPRSRL